MARHRVTEWISQKFAALKHCERGNVAVIFGLSLIPIIGLTGAAIDYSRAAAARTAMQTALDAAALILSKKAQELKDPDLDKEALAVFKANFHYPGVNNPTVNATYSTTSSGAFSLKMTANASVDTTLAGIWQPTIGIGTNTEVVWGIIKIELALALDNTGSMQSNNKMTELKKAAKQLLDKLKPLAKKDGDVKVAIIPFNTDVNMGTNNVGANWIRWDEWEAADINHTCMKNGKEVTDNNKRIKTAADCKDEDKNATWQLNAKSTWNGCVADRDQNNDTNNADPASKATRYVAHQASPCPVAAMMPLSYDWTALGNKIDAMKPDGNTNVTIGLQVAYQTLSPVAPFNASSLPSDELAKVIVLLTDGDNTQNRWSSNTKTIDARTKLACDTVKADKKLNIEIYTIRVIDGNSGLLQQCASDTSKYSDVQDPKNLEQVFGKIASDLSKLRLAR